MNEVRKYKIIIFSLIAVNLIIIGIWWIISFKRPMDDFNHREGQRGMNKRPEFKEMLKLDSLQAVQFDQLTELHKTQIGRCNMEIDSLKNVIRDEIIKQSNSARIDLLFKEIALKRTAVDTSIYHHFGRLRHICRQDQLAAFDSVMVCFLKQQERKGFPKDGGHDRPNH
jgi:hypothetical protein